MSARGRAALALLTVAAFAAGCAGTGTPVSEAPSIAGADVAAVLERRRQNAVRLQQSGDLAAAAAEWQVLTLIDPRSDAFRRELSAARAALAKVTSEQLQAGNAALKRGDTEAATDAFLRVLAVAPDNAEAANALRDIERRRVVRSQTDRVARLRPEDYGIPGARAALPRTAVATAPEAPRADVNRAYDFDQSMELFRAGDVRSGLNGFRRYVDANPADRAGRQEIGNAVYERARTLEAQGQGDQALALYDQAKSLAGSAGPWDAQGASLRKRLAAEQYEQGMRLYRNDLAGAIRHLQAAVAYDPSSTTAQAKLQEAKLLQDKLKRIDGGATR
jgi:tetratricopeptide (TPR) repeat protein